MFDDSPSRNHKKSLNPSVPKISADGVLISTDNVTTHRGSSRRWSLTSAASRKKMMEPPTPVYKNTPTKDNVPTNIRLVEEKTVSPTSTVASVATYFSKAKSTVSTTSKAKPAASTTLTAKSPMLVTSKASRRCAISSSLRFGNLAYYSSSLSSNDAASPSSTLGGTYDRDGRPSLAKVGHTSK